MKGLGRELNRLASKVNARTTSRLMAKEDCRMSDTYSGCKHASKAIWLEKASAVDIVPNQLVMESNEYIQYLFGDMYAEEKLEVVSDVTFIKDGVEYAVAVKS
jgi:hypothetical protein